MASATYAFVFMGLLAVLDAYSSASSVLCCRLRSSSAVLVNILGTDMREPA